MSVPSFLTSHILQRPWRFDFEYAAFGASGAEELQYLKKDVPSSLNPLVKFVLVIKLEAEVWSIFCLER